MMWYFGALAIIAVGMAFWLLSVLRPTPMGEAKKWKGN